MKRTAFDQVAPLLMLATCVLALLCLPSVSSTSSPPADSVHFGQPFDFERERDYIRPAAKRLLLSTVQAVETPNQPSRTVRETFGLSPFYQQWIDVEGLPVVASEKVNPYALKEAAWLIRYLIGHRPDVLQAMAQNRVRLSVMAYSEMTTQIPEHSDLRPSFYWDRRARGLGATPMPPSVSCGEENLLNFPGDPYETENILIHEFSHALHQMGLNTVDPGFDNRLRAVFEEAMAKGLWKGTYASTNKEEYWAEGAQSWFNTNRENDAEHNQVNTRTELKNYDPELATLLSGVFGDTDWRYTPAATRTHLPHLQGFNPQDSPTFEWPPELITCYQQLSESTGNGGDKWVNLDRHKPSQLSRLNPSIEDDRTEVLFVNNRGAEITHYWVASNGIERYFGRAGSYGVSFQYSFVGHIWLVKDQHGKSLAMFQADKKTGRAYFGPRTLTKVSGDEQEAGAGRLLEVPLVVEVRDQDGNVLVGAAVTFAVTTGGGALSVTTATTNSSGQVASTLTRGSQPGTNTVEVIVAGLKPIIFTAFGKAMPQTLTKVSGDEQKGPAGTALSAPFVVSVLDQNGKAFAGATVVFTVTAGKGVLSVESATTDSSGQVASTLTLGSQPGTNAVEVTVEGLESVTFTVTAQATPDFDGNGVVGFGDFVRFAAQFGLSQGDAGYDTRYDLDGDRTIGFGDFVIFANAFGKEISSS